MRLRFAGVCRVCGDDLPASSEAIYEQATRTVQCVGHGVNQFVATETPPVMGAIDVGTAGASARREFERRKARRDQRVRARHPKIGGLLLALSDEPQST